MAERKLRVGDEPVDFFGTVETPTAALADETGEYVSEVLVLPRGKTVNLTIMYDFTGTPTGDAPYLEVGHKRDRDAEPKFTKYTAAPPGDALVGDPQTSGFEVVDCSWTHVRMVYPHTSGEGAVSATAYITSVSGEA